MFEFKHFKDPFVKAGLFTSDQFDMLVPPQEEHEYISYLLEKVDHKKRYTAANSISEAVGMPMFMKEDVDDFSKVKVGSAVSGDEWIYVEGTLFFRNPLSPTLESTVEEQVRKSGWTVSETGFLPEMTWNDIKTKLEVTVDKETDYLGLDDEGQKAKATEIADNILSQALSKNASDIHLTAGPRVYTVHVRVDGLLELLDKGKMDIYEKLQNTLMLKAGLNAEFTKPQSGDFQLDVPGSQQPRKVRLEMIPSQIEKVRGMDDRWGKFTMRILGSDKIMRLDEIGLPEAHMEAYKEAAKQKSGLILVTGPTGSGKSTTLDALITYIQKLYPKKEYYSIEDPVETIKDGVVQVPLGKGVTTADALRSLLRGDPDVIMVGEIRDRETAELCIHAAATGHLVLGTLHTNDSHSTVDRLVDLGVDRHKLGEILKVVSAQRLVPKVCPYCAERKTFGSMKMEDSEFTKAMRHHELGEYFTDTSRIAVAREGKDCSHCDGSGYKGRVMINEVFINTHASRLDIIEGLTGGTIRKKQLGNNNFIPMMGHMAYAINQGFCDYKTYEQLDSEKDNEALLQMNSIQEFKRLIH